MMTVALATRTPIEYERIGTIMSQQHAWTTMKKQTQQTTNKAENQEAPKSQVADTKTLDDAELDTVIGGFAVQFEESVCYYTQVWQ